MYSAPSRDASHFLTYSLPGYLAHSTNSRLRNTPDSVYFWCSLGVLHNPTPATLKTPLSFPLHTFYRLPSSLLPPNALPPTMTHLTAFLYPHTNTSASRRGETISPRSENFPSLPCLLSEHTCKTIAHFFTTPLLFQPDRTQIILQFIPLAVWFLFPLYYPSLRF